MSPLSKSSNSKLKNLVLSTTIVSSLLLVLPSCRIPQLRPAEQVRELPVTFNGVATEDSSAQIGIDEFFNDPILTSLIDEGLTGNLELKNLAEDIQIANNEVLRRRGAYLPFVTLGGGAALNKYSPYTLLGADNAQNLQPNLHHFPQPMPDFLAAANLSWQIDVWRQLRNARDAACLRFLGTTEGRNYVVTRLVADIAENYYTLLALDKRIENLDQIIELQQASLERAKSLKIGAQGTELGVQRFTAEVRKNQSEKLIIKQDIIEVENRINFLLGRFPQPVERSSEFFKLNLQDLRLGLPPELLRNRPDIRKAELELTATGLDIQVARANFYPKVMINSGVGYEAFNTRYFIASPESLVWGVAGDLVAPVINRTAIKADYQNANAKQLQALYDYQRIILNAFTEVVNRYSMVQNYSNSIEIKQKQLESLEASVDVASKLFQAAQVQYMDVLFAQRDLVDARMVLIDTKKRQLSAIVNTYQALGGGLVRTDFGQGTLIIPEEATAEQSVIPPSPEQN